MFYICSLFTLVNFAESQPRQTIAAILKVYYILVLVLYTIHFAKSQPRQETAAILKVNISLQAYLIILAGRVLLPTRFFRKRTMLW